ncbi:uncharacterized protein Z518_06839 [Rhinocladiella mackenziei CBS 650.93]|uniref:Rhinocladiella mackenziei CBS 650.93 unplaced genomic scaffold supercont1.5, whole genome shotgun sequence n=1 Tax=Rhinocladiella mackenziei CBS 650.93 TaxID=1442369 RepID=A0A0D2FMN6_9EURO|nr:uncharacterized protein Z518_06839 [Rhinocladiella mackenziei CBS 650.93]KIX03287.1 hypothetical protein Z518_06839 [Rhinocladiella mackenziei CBS 650.93]
MVILMPGALEGPPEAPGSPSFIPVEPPSTMITVDHLPSLLPDEPKVHHVGSPPTGFQNPWPSSPGGHGRLLRILRARFGKDTPDFVPVPDRSELVPIQKIDFFNSVPGFKVTWIGHASFWLQTSKPPGAARGIHILCDALFSERTSPVTWAGPKRYTPTPCTLQEFLDAVEVDIVLISHNHYDHADANTLKAVYAKRKKNVRFLVGLHNSRWLTSFGIDRACITELDWWDGVEIQVEGVGKVRITCLPTQHSSARTVFDRDHDLWCSFAVQDCQGPEGKKVYFAGDTAYRSIPAADMTREEEDQQPACPAFQQIGDLLGPFDLALLPIGLCEPRTFMSDVHANSWDSIKIHQDIRSKKSIGMHWGTVRGGLSRAYEDVRTPPKHWKMAAEEAGLKWGEEIGLMDIGETLVLS